MGLINDPFIEGSDALKCSHMYEEDFAELIRAINEGRHDGNWTIAGRGFVVYYTWCPRCDQHLFILLYPSGEIRASHTRMQKLVPRPASLMALLAWEGCSRAPL